MAQTRDEIDPNLAERLCWQAARRDDSRVARRLYRKPVVDGVYQLDQGALLDDFFYFLYELGVVDWLHDVRSTALQREMVPVVQYVVLYSLKTLFGVDSVNALPPLLFSDEALMRLVGFNAQQVRQGVCQRGAAKRQGPRTAGPLCPDTLAENIVQVNVRDLEALFKRMIRALARTGVLAPKVTGIVDATDLETTAQYEGCGHVTRPRKVTDTRGKMPAIEGTVSGLKLIILSDARTKMPLAGMVVPMHAHEVLSMRALVTPARTNLAGGARLHTVVVDRGFLDGVDLWWLQQHGILFVVPAKENMAVTVDAQAQAATGEGVAIGRRAHTVRHHNRRDFQPHTINAVVVRQWNGHAYGPAGNTVFLTNIPVDKPLQPIAVHLRPLEASGARRLRHETQK